MKKAVALWLVLAAVIGLLAGCSNAPVDSQNSANGVIQKVALVTDAGAVDDGRVNQACWQGVESWSKQNDVACVYYQPAEDTTEARVLSIIQAVEEGANVIVVPGYLFGAALLEVMGDKNPEVYFLAIDVDEDDLTYDHETYYEPSSNVACISFAEEQAGYLAGYAAVRDGYTRLGFLGGAAAPAVIRYGYGYIQGADAAAQEIGVDIEINYTYGDQSASDDAITAKMEDWYGAGTEIVFACGGSSYTSVVKAALQHNGMVIGVDVDQYNIGEGHAYNPFVTSAVKGLQNVTEKALSDLQKGEWDNYGGEFRRFGLREGDYVGLPEADASWGFRTFTKDEYQSVYNGIRSGEMVVDNDISDEDRPVTSEHTIVRDIP